MRIFHLSSTGQAVARLVLASAGLLAGSGLPFATQAQPAAQAVRNFDIPGGPLSQVLPRFAAEAGVQVSIDGAFTASLDSAGVRGSYSIDSGFSELLRGTGLEAVRQPSGTYTLRRVPAAAKVRESTLDTVEVRATTIDDKEQPYRQAGSSAYISRDDIERFRGSSVGDIFKGTAGVLVGENRNSGGLDVNIRGMQGQNRVPVVVDGARQETTVYRGYAGVASRSYIDPDLIGGIEIDKGPTLSAQGTGAVGGLVSMRTINVDDIVRPGQTLGLRLRGQAIGNNSGSPSPAGTSAGLFVLNEYHTNCQPGAEANCAGRYNLSSMTGPSGDTTLDRPGTLNPQSWAGSIAIAKRLESIDLVAAYATRRQGNYYAGKHGPSPTVDLSNTSPGVFNLWTNVYPTINGVSRFRAEERIVNTNYDSRSTLLKGKVYLPDDQDLELSWLRYRSTYGELMPSQLMAFDYARQTDNSEITADTYASRYHWNPADNDAIDLRANLWRTATDSVNRFYSGTLQDSPWASNGREKYKRTGIDLSNTSVLTWGSSRAELRYGAAAQSEDLNNVPEKDGSTNAGRDGERKEYSAFGGVRYQPVPSVTLDAGTRYTRYSALDHQATSVCTSTFDPETGSSTGSCQSVMLGKVRNSGSAPVASVSWEPVTGYQIYGRYAEALRMPSLFEATGGFSVGTIVGSNLRPEHARNKEIGFNVLKNGVLLPADKVRLKLAYFRNTTDDYLTRTIGNANESDDGSSGVWRIRNIDRARFDGIELTGSYDAGWFFTEFGATKYNRIETCHSGSYRRQQCTDYGIATSYINNMIPPRWHGTLTLGGRLLDRKLVMGVRGTFMGRRNAVPEYDSEGVNSGFATPVVWNAYRVYDLFATYRYSDQVSVDFNLDNFTDRYYLDALGLGLVPAPGRTARLSLTLQF